MIKLFKYEESSIYTKLFEKGFADFWTHNSVNYDKDYLGFQTKLPKTAQDVFMKTIGFQSVMDSGVVNGYIPLAKDSEDKMLQALYMYIAQNESIHSLSYAYGLQQTFGNQADQILEELEKTPEVQDRMKVEEAVEEAYSIAVENNLPHKNNLRLQHLINTYLLEHIKFPVSFFVVFWLNDKYSNPLNGFTQALKEIANDELNLHTVANMNVIKKGIKSGEFDRYDVENLAKNRAMFIYEEEEKWVDFLLGKEDLKGLNKDLYLYFVKYQTYLALKKLGIETEEVPKKSVVSWFDNYRDISKAQVSQQETDGVSYQNFIVDDVSDLGELELYI